MSLSGLPADELARIDDVCMAFESDLRLGKLPPIDDVVGQYVSQYGDRYAELLRVELLQVRVEIESSIPDLFLTAAAQSEAEHSSGDFLPPRKLFGAIELPVQGEMIGPYRILGTLGQGGMGVVFQAIDTRLNRSVAVKMLAGRLARRRDLNERFQRESRAVAAISHPNIVELFDVGQSEQGLPYAVMEFLDGELMDARLDRESLSIDETRRLGAQIADALETAHLAGVVHRDLKPHNIMLVRRSGSGLGHSDSEDASTATIVKLFDFGLSRVPASDDDDDSAERTREGMILGTPGYMAPEQARGEAVTPAVDVFALGCILFQTFYGRHAFDGSTKAARIAATINHDPVGDPERRRDDPDLADLIDQCLKKPAGERPQSAGEIAKRLRGGRTTGTSSRPRVVQNKASRDPVSRSRRFGQPFGRRQVLTLALAAGGVAVGAAVWSRRPTNSLAAIESLAVLSLVDVSENADEDQAAGPIDDLSGAAPIGDGDLNLGQQLSALLVHELSRLRDVRVLPFRPMTATDPAQFQQIGRAMNVDALVTGTIRKIGREPQTLQIDLQLVSSDTGQQLWGKQIRTAAADNLLRQSGLAGEIASAIERRLTSTNDRLSPPNLESFRCLVDGATRSDPDSIAGLTKALMCFQKAHEMDPRFADPLAGIALTSITLAAQASIEEMPQYVLQARQRSDEALRQDPRSIDARLAAAMLDWQTVGRYDQAERALRELTMIEPNNWRVRHEYGLLLLALAKFDDAAKMLREASLLNPLSMMAKVDRARASWFAGDASRAIDDAKYLVDRDRSNDAPRGLLIDLCESQSRWADAAALDESISLANPADKADYLGKRRESLVRLPYGPFGEKANLAIWQTRMSETIEPSTIADWVDPLPPMLPLLLAVHPSFQAVRSQVRVRELLPSSSQPLAGTSARSTA